MASRRGGLGRGIGSLIPGGALPRRTAEPETSNPTDVLFGGGPGSQGADAPSGARDESAAGERRGPAGPGASDAESELRAIPGLRLIEVDPETVVPNPHQPRKEFKQEELEELAHSIKEFGLFQPIVVRRRADAPGYELVMGERRLRASKLAGRGRIPALLRETSDENLLRDALLENLHRSDLNPLEEASAYQQLLDDFGITQEELADRIGRSRPQISNTLRLLRLPEAVQTKVASGVLSAGHARALLRGKTSAEIERAADRVVKEGLSVRETEALASRPGQSRPTRARPRAGGRQERLDEIAERVGDALDTKVRIRLSSRKGQVQIDFATIGDLNRILTRLGLRDGFGGPSVD